MPVILVPPLITVWLQVRVLPGPPMIHKGLREPLCSVVLLNQSNNQFFA